MENYLGEFWIFKLACLAGAAYLVYFFIKDRMRKKQKVYSNILNKYIDKIQKDNIKYSIYTLSHEMVKNERLNHDSNQ